MTIPEYKYYLIVRLFKNWKDSLSLFGGCKMVYKSMRVEVNIMDFGDSSSWSYLKWKLLHQEFQLDTLYATPEISEEYLNNMYENLPFDILIKTDLSRIDMLNLETELHTPITADIIPDEEISEDNAQPTYHNWMQHYKETLDKFTDIMELPASDYDEFNPDLSIP